MKTNNPVLLQRTVCSHSSAFLKRLILFLMLACISAANYAQRLHPDKIDIWKDKLEYQGYTVRPILTLSSALGYDIYKANKLLVHQYKDPLSGLGISKKEDVYKVAKWVIAQYAKTSRFPAMVPPATVKELKLSSAN